MAARLFLLCGLLVAAAATAPPVTLEVATLALIHGVVEGLSPGGPCATVVVELADGLAAQQVAACPDGSGIAAFALPLTVGAGATGQPARLLVASQGRQWQQLLSLSGAVAVRADMRQAHEVAAAPAEQQQAAPTKEPLPPAPTSAAPITSTCPACPRRSCTELEEAGGRSLPTLLLLAALPAPTCPPALPTKPPTNSPTVLPPTALTPAAIPRRLLLPGLGAACAVQAAALTILLLRRGRGAAQAAAPADDGGSSLDGEEAATSPRRPARRLSLRDACTSPLVLLASPFVGAKQRAAADAEVLGAIAEEGEEGPQAQEEAAAAQPQQYGWQKPAPPVQHNASYGSLPAPPNGWTRDAWGRLQRLSGGSAYKLGHGLLHPPPFGAAPGTAFRSPSSEE